MALHNPLELNVRIPREFQKSQKILNAVLSGVHPDTHKKSQHPGFMAFFPGNGAALEGRSILSPALRHRCTVITVEEHCKKDLHSIFAKKTLLPQKINEYTNEFIEWQQEGCNLRDYEDYLDDMHQQGLS